MTARTTEEIAAAIAEWGTCAVLDPTDPARRTLVVYVDDEHKRDHYEAATRLRALDAENARLRAELDAFRKRYEPYTCKHCNQSTAHPSKVCAACWGM